MQCKQFNKIRAKNKFFIQKNPAGWHFYTNSVKPFTSINYNANESMHPICKNLKCSMKSVIRMTQGQPLKMQIINATDKALNALCLRCIIHHNLSPQVSIIFYKGQVYRMVLVCFLPGCIIEKH